MLRSSILPPPDIRPPFDLIRAILIALAAASLFLCVMCLAKDDLRDELHAMATFRAQNLQVDNTSTLGTSTTTSTTIVSGRTQITSVNPNNSTLHSIFTPVAGTVEDVSAVEGLVNGTFDTTPFPGGMNISAVAGRCNGSRVAGVSGISCFAILGESGVTGNIQDSVAVRGHAHGNGATVRGVYGTGDGTGTDSFGVYGEALNAATNNYGGLFTALGGTNNWAIAAFSGDVDVNKTSGDFFANRNTTLGGGVQTWLHTINGRVSQTSTTSTQLGAIFQWNPTAGTTTPGAALRGSALGTMDSSGGAKQARGVWGSATTTPSAGTQQTNIGVLGEASGGNSNDGARFSASGAGTLNRAGYFTSSGATNNHAIFTDDGNVILNAISGFIRQGNGAHVQVSGTAPALTSCGGGSPSAVGTDGAFLLTTGTAATACTVTFSRTWTVAPSCTVTARVGTNQASITYTISATVLTFSAAPASALFDVQCVCTSTSCT